MYSQKKEIIRNDIQIPNEINSHLDNQLPQSNPPEDINLPNELLIINNDEDPQTNYRYYQKEINISDKNKKITPVPIFKKRIYNKIRSDSYKPRAQKAQISNYIYHTRKDKLKKHLTNEYIRYNSNSKYLIKNPIKEKSKNKINNNYNNNKNLHKIQNNRNLRLINNIVNNTDINENEFDNNFIKYDNENYAYINNTNDNLRPHKNLNINNTDFIDNINLNKGGNINLQLKKKQYIAFNKKFNTQYKNVQHSPRENRISFIYDYSQENNKDSYYVESPNVTKNMTVYPLKSKLKKNNKTDLISFNNNNKNPKKKYNKLKKQIEDSRLKFEKIREIEKKIKNYFNINGLDIENRELYDQSATMIQSAFRAYYSRMKLFKELNTFVNIGLLIDNLKKIYISRKVEYWENFLKGILNYLSYLNNINNGNSSNLININEDKITFSDKKDSKKIPNSYRRKTTGKKLMNANSNTNLKTNKLLLPQLCISFDLISNNSEYINKDIDLGDQNININEKNKYLEEQLKKIMLENEQLKKANENLKNQYENKSLNQMQNDININNNIVKNTQESVELQFDNEINLPLIYNNKTNNNNNDTDKIELKKSKLKYLLKSKILKIKEYLHKYFLTYYYNTLLLKNSEKKPIIYTKNIIKSSSNGNINNSNEYSFREKKEEKMHNKKLKKLKNLFIDLEKRRKSITHNKFIILYFKGLLDEIKNQKIKNNENENINEDKYKNINNNENIIIENNENVDKNMNKNENENIIIEKNENIEEINDKEKEELK